MLSLVTCLCDPCLQVCDTGGVGGVRCVPAAAPAASASTLCGTGKHTAAYCVLASGSAGNPRSWLLLLRSSPDILNVFCILFPRCQKAQMTPGPKNYTIPI